MHKDLSPATKTKPTKHSFVSHYYLLYFFTSTMKLPTALSLAALSFQLHASAAGDAHNVNVDTPSAESALEYGVDVSFPMHHSNVTAANDNPLGDKQKFYEDLIQGCVEHYDQEKEAKGHTIYEKVVMRRFQSLEN